MSACSSHTPGPFNWDSIRVVVFDVDGTLYRQRPLRLRMAARLGWHALTRLDLQTVLVLRAYRSGRERLAEEATPAFEAVLRARTAEISGVSVERVGQIVERWIDTEPLGHLGVCAYPGVGGLFRALRESGRKIGVLSDYPARDKLAALSLSADEVVCAAEVDALKPSPAGLVHLMRKLGSEPRETVLIGDRLCRDGWAAQRAGAHALLLSRKPIQGWLTFSGYEDAIFAPVRG